MIDLYINTENCKNKQQNWKSKEELEKEKREVIHKGFLIIKLNEIRPRIRCVQLKNMILGTQIGHLQFLLFCCSD